MDAKSVATHAQDIIQGVLGARRLDEAVRVCLLWSFVAKKPDARFQWLLFGATCATKMATATLAAILGEKENLEPVNDSRPSSRDIEPGTDPDVATEGADSGHAHAQKAASEPFHAPKSLRDWLLFSMSETQLDKVLGEVVHNTAPEVASKRQEHHQAQLSTQNNITDVVRQAPSGAISAAAADSFTVQPLHCSERTFTWLCKLIEELQKHGCAVQCLPVLWLQVLLCAQTSGRDGAVTMLFKLSDWLQKLGLFHQAKRIQELVGMVLEIHLDFMLWHYRA